MVGDSTPMIMLGAGVVMLGFYVANRFYGLRRLAMVPGGAAMLPILTRLNNLAAICGILVIGIGILLPFL